MLYITIAGVLFCLTLKGYCGKRLSSFVSTTEDAFLFNLLRMLFCIMIGAALVFFEGSWIFLSIEPRMIAVCALSGLSNAAFLIFWMLAIRRNSMVSVDVGLTLGAIIPSVLCTLLFGDDFSLPKMVGFAMIILATFILSGRGKSEAKRSLVGLVLLTFSAIGDGLSSFSQQLYRHCYTEQGSIAIADYPKTVFHFYTYAFAALVLFSVLVAYRIFAFKKAYTEEGKKAEKPFSFAVPMRAILHIFIMALCLFAANYLQTVVTNDFKFSSQMLYPILKGGCLITVNITAMLFFGEKITKRSITGSLAALLGIVAMSIL